MTISLMVFDVAGTTVNDEGNAVAHCVCDAMRDAGFQVELKDVDPVMGVPKPLAIRSLLSDRLGCAPEAQLVGRIHADFQQRMVTHYRTAPSVRPVNHAESVFEALRRLGVRVTLDTGFDRLILDTILQRLGWDKGAIDDSITSDEVDAGRPAPDMIRTLMRRAGVTDPAAVGKVGDSVSDIEEGLNAGCGLVVAVENERTTPHLHRFAGVPAIERLSELLPLVCPAAESSTISR
jgi:phosphonatase-like hydrolase